MSNEKQYTERDLILAKREAMRRALYDMAGWSMQVTDDATNRSYPLPKVVRPRVVTRADGTKLRIVDGQLQFQLRGACEWLNYSDISWDCAMIRAMQDLLANPAEEVSE